MQQLPGSFVTFEIMSHLWNSLVPSVVLLANSVSFSGFYSIRSRNKIGRRWLETISSILTTVWCFIKKKKKEAPLWIKLQFFWNSPTSGSLWQSGEPLWKTLTKTFSRYWEGTSPREPLGISFPSQTSTRVSLLPWFTMVKVWEREKLGVVWGVV